MVAHAIQDVVRGETGFVDGWLRIVESKACLGSKSGELGLVDRCPTLVLGIVDDRGDAGPHA